MPPSDDGLGLENASFKWNEVEETAEKPNDESSNNPVPETPVSDVDSTLLSENMDHRFELRDINVRFPEGELSLITGPTASGKTALLVRCFSPFLESALTIGADGTPWRDDAAPRRENHHVEDPEPGRRVWPYACYIVRGAVTVAPTPIDQGEYFVWVSAG